MTGEVLEGYLPNKAMNMVQEWIALYKDKTKIFGAIDDNIKFTVRYAIAQHTVNFYCLKPNSSAGRTEMFNRQRSLSTPWKETR